MNIIQSLGSLLQLRFPFHQIAVCESEDYLTPVILISAKAREPLGWVEVVAIEMEGSTLNLRYCYLRPNEDVYMTFDMADPKFDPDTVLGIVPTMLRSHMSFSQITRQYMGRRPKGKLGEKKKKAAKKKARKMKRRGR